jgi:glycosyltransferase involved in cell wall biosynthesis
MKFATPYPMIVIIPAKNEAKSITQVIKDIQYYFDGTVLVIDDASTDNTAQLAEEAGATVLSLTFSLGAWGAIQTGLRYAVKHGYSTAITMDADGQHEAASIPILLKQLTDSCDVVIGAFPQRGSHLRQLAWVFFRKISSIHLEDLTSGLRVYNRSAITLLASRAATLLEYQDMGVLMLLNQADLHIKEVPINMRPRTDGHSRIFSSWWAVGYYMMQTLVLCVGRRKFR